MSPFFLCFMWSCFYDIPQLYSVRLYQLSFIHSFIQSFIHSCQANLFRLANLHCCWTIGNTKYLLPRQSVWQVKLCIWQLWWQLGPVNSSVILHIEKCKLYFISWHFPDKIFKIEKQQKWTHLTTGIHTASEIVTITDTLRWASCSPDLNLTPLAAFLRFCRAQRGSDRNLPLGVRWVWHKNVSHPNHSMSATILSTCYASTKSLGVSELNDTNMIRNVGRTCNGSRNVWNWESQSQCTGTLENTAPHKICCDNCFFFLILQRGDVIRAICVKPPRETLMSCENQRIKAFPISEIAMQMKLITWQNLTSKVWPK